MFTRCYILLPQPLPPRTNTMMMYVLLQKNLDCFYRSHDPYGEVMTIKDKFTLVSRPMMAYLCPKVGKFRAFSQFQRRISEGVVLMDWSNPDEAPSSPPEWTQSICVSCWISSCIFEVALQTSVSTSSVTVSYEMMGLQLFCKEWSQCGNPIKNIIVFFIL